VSIIFAGVDKTGSRIFYTHPSGTYRGYKATAVGAGRETAFGILKDEYKENMSLDDATRLAVKCLVKALEARQLPLRMKIAVIPTETKKLEMLSAEKIEAIVKELGPGK
jgi:proteasome alpha subunit